MVLQAIDGIIIGLLRFGSQAVIWVFFKISIEHQRGVLSINPIFFKGLRPRMVKIRAGQNAENGENPP